MKHSIAKCKFSQLTATLWLPNTPKCFVCHCYYKGDVQVAHGHARYATEGDRIDGDRIEADYLCVRSAYCNPSCYAYEPETTNKPPDSASDADSANGV